MQFQESRCWQYVYNCHVNLASWDDTKDFGNHIVGECETSLLSAENQNDVWSLKSVRAYL
jgi:hypothetical protein